MRAHVLNEQGVVIDTIMVESLDDMPNLVDASLGGSRGHTYANGEFTPPAGPSLAARKAAFVQRVYAEVDAIYASVIGNRATEYERKEREATEFAAANYQGTVPPMVQAWATATGWSPQVACDDILQASQAWRTAQELLCAARHLATVSGGAAASDAALQAAEEAWLTDKKAALAPITPQ